MRRECGRRGEVRAGRGLQPSAAPGQHQDLLTASPRSPSEDGVLAATEPQVGAGLARSAVLLGSASPLCHPQPKATAMEGTTVSPSLQQGDAPAGGRDGCRQPGDVGLQGKSMGIQGKRGLPSSYTQSLLCWDPHPHGALAGDRTDGSPFGTSSVEEEEEEEPSPAHSSPGVVQVGWGGCVGLWGLYGVEWGCMGLSGGSVGLWGLYGAEWG